MKKTLKFSIFLSLIILSLIIFLSTIGLETTKLNSNIQKIVKDFNSEIEIELKKIKILLDPFNLRIKLKTIGSNIKIGENYIETENVKTNISIESFLRNDFSIKNLQISSKSVPISNLVSLIRKIHNSPELYILEKTLKKGFLIFDLDLEFDSNGKVKDNYKLTGFIKDTELQLFKKYKLNKINFIFDLNSNIFRFSEIQFRLNNIPLESEMISVKNIKDDLFFEGILENKKIIPEDDFLKDSIKNFLPEVNLKKFNFKSKNEFNFILNKKRFKVTGLKVSSKINVENITVKNEKNLNSLFKKSGDEIKFINHQIEVNYDKKRFFLKGRGDVFFQEKKDFIKYSFNKNGNELEFETYLEVVQNPISINFLGYDKKLNSKAYFNFKGTYFFNDKIHLEKLIFNEEKNQITIEDITLDKNFRLKNFKKINLDYMDKEKRENNFTINNQDKKINIVGTKLNANNLIEKLINNEENQNNFFKDQINLNVKIDKVYLDKDYEVNNLNGNIELKNNIVSKANINANFSTSKKLKYTVVSKQDEKVTTLFLDEAKPLVKRYKFIKGFNDGSLDFYSSKKNEDSNSILKIYDFRLTELPILTKILTLASLQGIADILSGEGIAFDELEMRISKKNNLIKIQEMYAIGPAISILMDGYVDKNKLVSLRGSLVPATTINKVIGNLPILGKILVGSKTGEGVFGVSFKIKGPPKNLQTTVNPIKTLTPRFITRTLEKIKKN